ncbi:hypothetical protein D3C76_1448330 [compost metagenome]
MLDLPAERRLGDMQALRRAGEVEGFRDFPEVAQVSQLHDTSRVWNQTEVILDSTAFVAQSLGQKENNPKGIATRARPDC